MAKLKLVIEVNRAEAWAILKGLQRIDTKPGESAFSKVDDAVHRYDDAKRKEEREKEDKKLGR